MTEHVFQECAARGAEGEMAVARYLEALGFELRAIGQNGEGQWPEGAERVYDAPDFLVVRHKSGTPSALNGKTLEVKTDSVGDSTGNAAIELISNTGSGRKGWAYTTKADYLAFLYQPSGKLIIFETEKLRDGLTEWQKTAKLFKANNPTLTAIGLLIPISKLEKMSVHVGSIK